MAKQKKLTSAQKAAKEKRQKEYMTMAKKHVKLSTVWILMNLSKETLILSGYIKCYHR
jgi:uncharacterized protein YnzC (UPF0291/DUF896 family)